ncbi:MAG TPA: molybdopterin molybdotransferase MoeA [Caulobacteraceae bacterium]
MNTFDEACAVIGGLAGPLGTEQVRLDEAYGRVLAASVAAASAAPAFSVSAMDGYAVRDADLGPGGGALRVVGESFAGPHSFGGVLEPGCCVRIFTGAAVPEGADRVVVQEVVRRDGDMAVIPAPTGGRHIRAAGSDFAAGEVLLQSGERLTPQAMIAAAAADTASLEVFRRPRVTILSTGDELVEPGQAAGRPGTIPDSVSLGVAALSRLWGAEVAGRRRLGDDLSALSVAAGEALQAADVVLTTGGASVGEKDFARAMFAPFGLEVAIDKVAMKPGKPIWVGRAQGRVVVGLPGNPTSALVTARLFLAPILAAMGGRSAAEAWAWRAAPLAAPLPAGGERESFERARQDPAGVASVASQDSSAQKELARADVLIRRPPGAPALAAGAVADVLDF